MQNVLGTAYLYRTLGDMAQRESRKFHHPVPEVTSAQPSPKKAARNIYWFNWLSYAIAVALLAGAGFRQLYANQPIFGANDWSDYFSLLAWGFVAEATRDAIEDGCAWLEITRIEIILSI